MKLDTVILTIASSLMNNKSLETSDSCPTLLPILSQYLRNCGTNATTTFVDKSVEVATSMLTNMCTTNCINSSLDLAREMDSCESIENLSESDYTYEEFFGLSLNMNCIRLDGKICLVDQIEKMHTKKDYYYFTDMFSSENVELCNACLKPEIDAYVNFTIQTTQNSFAEQLYILNEVKYNLYDVCPNDLLTLNADQVTYYNETWKFENTSQNNDDGGGFNNDESSTVRGEENQSGALSTQQYLLANILYSLQLPLISFLCIIIM